MEIIRWKPIANDPFRALLTFQEEAGSLFNGFLPTARKREEEFTRGAFYPAVDIYEGEKGISIKVELPGMKRKDVHVEINDGVLTLKGERKIEKDEKEKNYHRIERGYGSFHRSFTLPAAVDHDKIKAYYKDGILEITLPMSEEIKPKLIPVEVN